MDSSDSSGETTFYNDLSVQILYFHRTVLINLPVLFSFPERSNFSSITKYDDALISLANARCGYKNSIVKYLTRINELELAKLVRLNLF